MRADREILLEIDRNIVCIIEDQHPFGTLTGKPTESYALRFLQALSGRYALEIGFECIDCGGVDKEYI